MASIILTESGNRLMAETVYGVSQASSLNDIDIQTIFKEMFNTDPVSRGWLVGTNWVWDSVNLRMKRA